jgi:hypothetical protein
MRMVDELQDPLRQGFTVVRGPDGVPVFRQGRMRCARCDAIPGYLHGIESAPICHPCQVALYLPAYDAWLTARETPTYVEKPKWWRRPVSPVLLLVSGCVYFWLLGFLFASASIGRAWP